MGLNSAAHLKLVLLVCTVAAAAAEDCNRRCGNVSIPYPFGISDDCYIDERFIINCTTTTSSSGQPIAHLRGGVIPVLNISVDPPELIVSANVTNQCYDSDFTWNSNWISFEKFSISNPKNRFTVVGCDTDAYIRDLTGSRFQTGCTLSCNKKSFEDWSCSGVGCCQTGFPKAIRNYTINITSFGGYKDVKDFNPCGYAFLSQNGSFNFSPQALLNLSGATQFPVVLDWAVGDQTCNEAKKNTSSYACKQNSRCQDSVSGIGYQCSCELGFQGNPYLSDPETGCKDVNEYEGDNGCSRRCHNVGGNYTCSCPLGYRGDGYKD
ncbi:wall-associated receptor kinase 2-like [Prosopis cineraria]|uniref:wall-associated receptor kinase 2-like n=1 Tax=Prosopis cineraria TaxID=364024 RepID=UPI0024106F9B|nr:wall-associated receptor kinase 2-like [Prosopis cineraria]